jgi:transmembrane sensor
MNNDRLYELISRKLAGQATKEELEELLEYFQKNPHDQYFDELITSYWNSQHETEKDDTDSDEHFNHILQMADETPQTADLSTENELIQFENSIRRRNKRRLIGGFAIAASFITVIFFSWWFASKKQDQLTSPVPVQQSEIVANKGTRSRIVLPDSSIVYLNADTKLNYPRQFSKNKREVFLDGEAFFNVKKDQNKPFIVHTAGIQVKVLGTTFNVKAYSADKSIETSLITGSIEVTVNNRPNEKITLSPNAKLVIKNFEIPETIEKKEESANPDFAINPLKPDPKNNTIAETQWIENRLVFRDESFDEVARMMERWYNVKIEIDDEELKTSLLSGTFEKETIEQALDALKYTKSFRYDTSSEKIRIYK